MKATNWIVSAMLVSGCGILSAESERVFFGTGGADGIYTALLDSDTGAISDLKVAVKTEGAGFLVKDKAGKFLYATGRGEGKEGGVAAFAIGEEGVLTPVNAVSAKGRGPCMVNLDATGKVCFVANYGSGSVAAFGVKADGSLAESLSWHQHEGSSVNESRQKGPHAHSIYPGPDNQFVYAADLGTDEVVIYKLDAEEAKMERVGEAKTPAGAGPRHMKFSPDGKWLYVLNELTLSVSVFERGEEGKLTLKETVSVLPEGENGERMTCSEILVSADGKFIYTANRDLNKDGGRDSLSLLSVSEDGGLELQGKVGAEVWIPRNIQIDPSGKWLLVAGQNSGEITVFSRNTESGELAFSGESVEVPQAMCIVF